jgi:hypothetical protein
LPILIQHPPKMWFHSISVNQLIFLFESKLLSRLLYHTLNNKNAFCSELSNAFDCVSQKENILLNTENKRIIGVLTGLEWLDNLHHFILQMNVRMTNFQTTFNNIQSEDLHKSKLIRSFHKIDVIRSVSFVLFWRQSIFQFLSFWNSCS